MKFQLDKAHLDGLRIGLLGGSFNPAHEGHLHISEIALKRLKLDHIFWLVSPQNPLKEADEMAPFNDRHSAAMALVNHPNIHISDYESKTKSAFTIDTLTSLQKRHQNARFVWIMGADGLINFHKWQRWTQIFQIVPVAIMDRPGYASKALRAKAAIRFQKNRIRSSKAQVLADMSPPAWVFLPIRKHSASATDIRDKGESPIHG